MLTVDLKVNGNLIGHMYIVNIGGFEKCTYEYTVYDVAERKCTNGAIEHERSKGAWELVKKIINKISKKVKK